MQKVQLYIEGNKIDLFKDDEVSITSSIQNVKDIAKVFTDFTKTFAIPASPNNNKIFKHFYNFNIDDGFDARTKKSATIELNSIPFKKGKIRLDGVPMKNNKPYSYKITFFGNTVNIIDLFGDDTFNEIASSFFSQFNVDYTATTVASRLQSGITVGSFSDAVLVPLITHTTRLFYDTNTNYGVYSTNGTLNKLGGNLNSGATDSDTNFSGVYYEELKDSLRVHILIKAIENHYGITFSDDFFNTSNAVYHDLYIWLHKKAGRIFETNIVSNLIPNYTAETDTNLFTTIVSSGNTFTFSDTGNPALRNVIITVQLNTSSNSQYSIVLKKDGVIVKEQVIAANTANGVLTYGEQVASYTNSSGGQTYGTDFQVYVKNNAQITFNSGSNTFFKTVITDFFNQNSTTTQTDLASNVIVTNTQTLIIQENIPKMKVIDFLTSLFKMFNLTAFEEDDGTIKVQSLDDFYASSITTWDLNEFMETDFEINPSLPYKEIDFGYEGLESFLAQDHLARFSKEWGTDEYKFNDGENSNSYDALGDIYEVRPQFEHMKYERLIDHNGTVTDIQIGWCVNDSESSLLGKPLLFYPVKVTSGTSIKFLNVEDRVAFQSHTDLTTYYVPSNSRALAASTSTENINFKLEENEYDFASNTPFDKTLFKLFYKSYIEKVFSIKNRITKLKGYLPLNFILQHNLADKILFKGNRYIINTLKINMNTGKSNLELLTDIRVANEILIGTVAGDNKEAGCLPPPTTITKKVFYELDATLGNSIVIYENESLSIPFNGNAKFYKLDLFGVIKVIQISSTGVTSNYQNC